MSVSHNTYLGPYFRCRTRTETVTVEVVACPNAACPRHGKRLSFQDAAQRYCPHCGTPIDRAFPAEDEQDAPDRWDVSDAIDEALSEVTGDDADFPRGFGYHLWLPNVGRFGGPKRAKADSSCGVEIVLDGVDIEAEKAWLDGAYPERETLVELYGLGRVETRWGLIRWCS
jgi:hypothetical protein